MASLASGAFSAVPTAFPVKIGREFVVRQLHLGRAWVFPAMLHRDARIDASCACCNFEMVLNVKDGQLLPHKVIGHFAVPACQWYQDIVFT